MRAERLERSYGKCYLPIRDKLRDGDMAIEFLVAFVSFLPSADLIGLDFNSCTRSYSKSHTTRMAADVLFPRFN